MDQLTEWKLGRLQRLYNDVEPHTCKLETKENGWEVFQAMKTIGANIDYIEFKSLIHKYKLSDVSYYWMDYLWEQHIKQKCNICVYYGRFDSSILSFNLDTKEKGEKQTAELHCTVKAIVDCLHAIKIRPFVVLSGRGYHIHVKLDQPVENKVLRAFIFVISEWAKDCLKVDKIDTEKVYISGYPSLTGSLRLFGSKHIKTGLFSHVLTSDGHVLGEMESWHYLDNYLKNDIVPLEHFNKMNKDLIYHIKWKAV